MGTRLIRCTMATDLRRPSRRQPSTSGVESVFIWRPFSPAPVSPQPSRQRLHLDVSTETSSGLPFDRSPRNSIVRTAQVPATLKLFWLIHEPDFSPTRKSDGNRLPANALAARVGALVPDELAGLRRTMAASLTSQDACENVSSP